MINESQTGDRGRPSATLTLRPHGLTLARRTGNGQATGGRGDRSAIHGWSWRSAKANSEWLQCLLPEKLPEGFQWVTCTVGKDSPSPADWKALRRRWIDAMRKSAERAGRTFLMHHVVEFQRRGAPHIHALILGAEPFEPISRWLRLAPGVSLLGQHCVAVRDAGAVARYQAKHGSRGFYNAQRAGAELNAEWREVTAGRLWGVRGDWSPYLGEPIVIQIPDPDVDRIRRTWRRYQDARMRAQGARRRHRWSARRNAGIGAAWDAQWLLRVVGLEGYSEGEPRRAADADTSAGSPPSRLPVSRGPLRMGLQLLEERSGRFHAAG